MSKRLFALIAILCMMPAVALAWTLNTWVKSNGGTIAAHGGAPQTVTKGSVFKTYTTTTRPFDVTVTANTGYNISNVN